VKYKLLFVVTNVRATRLFVKTEISVQIVEILELLTLSWEAKGTERSCG